MGDKPLAEQLTAEFFESYPLHRKYRAKYLPRELHNVVDTVPRLHMECHTASCQGGVRTFQAHGSHTGSGASNTTHANNHIEGQGVLASFRCAACDQFALFLLEFGPIHKVDEGHGAQGEYEVWCPQWVQKVGQWPRWNRRIDRRVEKALAVYHGVYRKGRTCEEEGFGIGALAYYRRIVEDFVRTLLDRKAARLEGDAGAAFQAQADAVRREWSGKAAIELVSDEIPGEARPGGHNPLSILYGDLSVGLHVKTEEECAAEAPSLRRLLEGFFMQLERRRDSDAFAALVHARLRAKGTADSPPEVVESSGIGSSANVPGAEEE